MATKTTRRAARESTSKDQPKATSAAKTEKTNGPRVKKVAEPVEMKEEKPAKEPAKAAKAKAETPAQEAARVELVEGNSYAIRNVTFVKNRPVVVVDERILSEVRVNSRFKVIGAGGGSE